MSPHSRTRTALALGAVLTALLAAESAQADYTAKVQAGTLTLTGDAASDSLALRLAPGAPGTLEADVGDDGITEFSFDRGTFVAIDVLAGRGDDEVRVDQQSGAFPDEFLTINGGNGDDTLRGGSGAESLIGGSGDDDVAGGDGDDDARLGAGNDAFGWNPGDDNDTVEGDDGADRLDVNGSGASESFDISANGQRVRLTRDVATTAMDLDEVEDLNVRAFGGADVGTVGDLSGTDLETAGFDLEGSGGGGDGAADTVIARGTAGADRPEIASTAGRVVVSGLAAQVQAAGLEATDDLTVDGAAGEDIATYRGTTGADEVAIVANGAEVATVPAGRARFDTAAVEDLVVAAGGGADQVGAVGNLAALTRLTLDGAGGDDRLLGGNGADTILAGSGNDFVDGQLGQDRALLGTGTDTFQWDPGDNSDTVEGEAGGDTLLFHGSGASEITEASANGGRVRFTRNVANVVMDLGGVERIDWRAMGGADTAIVGDLAGTELDTVDVDASPADSAVDTVFARATEAADSVSVGESGGRPAVLGLAVVTRMAGAEPQDDLVVEGLGGDDELTGGIGVPGPSAVSLDGGTGTDVARYRGTSTADTIAVVANGAEVSTVVEGWARLDATTEDLVIEALGGADQVSAVGNVAALTRLTLDGAGGDDRLLGGNGADTILAGSGHDFVDGQQGIDVAALGGGNDTFQWDPGDSSDTVEGQSGADALAFNGSGAAESFDVSANGGRVRFTRNIANVVMDLDDVERVGLRAFGGSDTTTVNDLAGTDVDAVDVDHSLPDGTSDPQPDTVVVGGTAQRDVVRLTRSGDQVLASGLAAQTRIAGSELLSDTLRVQTLGGDDVVTVSPAVEELITPVIDLGADE